MKVPQYNLIFLGNHLQYPSTLAATRHGLPGVAMQLLTYSKGG